MSFPFLNEKEGGVTMSTKELTELAGLRLRIQNCVRSRHITEQMFFETAHYWWHRSEQSRITGGVLVKISQILKGESTGKLSDYPYVEAFLIYCEAGDKK